jgi:hypothetical protein
VVVVDGEPAITTLAENLWPDAPSWSPCCTGSPATA